MVICQALFQKGTAFSRLEFSEGDADPETLMIHIMDSVGSYAADYQNL